MEKLNILNQTMADMIQLLEIVDNEKNLPLVLFNNMVKNDFYLEAVKPQYRQIASTFKEEKDVLNICKVTTVALKNYQDLKKRETSKKVAMMLLEKIDDLDIFE